MTMPLHPTWPDIALRLVLTVLAGAVIGLNRESRGHAAGFRTTILVALAASVSMIEANMLLSVDGKAATSFATMDVLRFPLGVLTGVGFIGGGAILKRGNLVTGVTTAATLWAITAIGLCFGAGLLLLGLAATAIAAATLWLLKWLDRRIRREQHAVLVIALTPSEPMPDLEAQLRPAGFTASLRRKDSQPGGAASLTYRITWLRPEIAGPPVDLLALIEERYAIESFAFEAEGGTEGAAGLDR